MLRVHHHYFLEIIENISKKTFCKTKSSQVPTSSSAEDTNCFHIQVKPHFAPNLHSKVKFSSQTLRPKTDHEEMFLMHKRIHTKIILS